MDDHLRGQLVAAVGPRGVGAGGMVHPINLVQLREVLAACAAAGVSVAAAGRASSEHVGVVIDAGRLDSVRVEPSALLVHAGGATPWTAVREAVAAQTLRVTGLPSVRSDTAGESVAQGEIAHRTLAGVDLLTAGGKLISAGGRTLKDVVGYDLAGLALGSGERLGTVVGVTLRLEPASARTPAEAGPGPWRGDVDLDVVAAFVR